MAPKKQTKRTTPSAKKSKSKTTKEEEEEEQQHEDQALSDVEQQETHVEETPTPTANKKQQEEKKKNDDDDLVENESSSSSSSSEATPPSPPASEDLDATLSLEDVTNPTYNFRKNIAVAAAKHLLAKRRNTSTNTTATAFNFSETNNKDDVTDTDSSPQNKKKSTAKKLISSTSENSNVVVSAKEIPSCVSLQTLRNAAQVSVLGCSSNGGGASSLLCSVGFHIVGTAPILKRDDSSFPENKQLVSKLNEIVEPKKKSSGSSASASASSPKTRGGTAKRRGRKQNDESDNDGGEENQEAEGEEEISNINTSIVDDLVFLTEQQKSSPCPKAFREEVINFPSCNHSCCKSCALQQLALQLASRGSTNLNENDTLALECSFCNGNSTILLNLNQETSSFLKNLGGGENSSSSSSGEFIISQQEKQEKDQDDDDNNKITTLDIVTKLFNSQYPFNGQSQSIKKIAQRAWCVFVNAVDGEDDKAVQAEKAMMKTSPSNKTTKSSTKTQQDSSSSSFAAVETLGTCGICENKQGKKYCEDCNFPICDGCQNTVHSRGGFKNHTLSSSSSNINFVSPTLGGGGSGFGSPTQQRSSALLAGGLPTRPCAEHTMYPVELYCLTCSRSICLMCNFAGDHKNHNVKPLAEVQQGARSEISEAASNLKVDADSSSKDFSSTLASRYDSVDTCAEEVFTVLHDVFDHLHKTLDQRKQNIANRIGKWQNSARGVASNDNVVVAAIVQAVSDIISACKSLPGSEDDENEEEKTTTNTSPKKSKGKKTTNEDASSTSTAASASSNNAFALAFANRDSSAVTADTLALRDAVRYRIDSMISNPLMKMLKNIHVDGDGSSQSNVEVMLRRAAAASSSSQNQNQNQNTVSLTPSFSVIIGAIEEALEQFVNIQADSCLKLPKWSSFVDLLAQKSDQSSSLSSQPNNMKQQQNKTFSPVASSSSSSSTTSQMKAPYNSAKVGATTTNMSVSASSSLHRGGTSFTGGNSSSLSVSAMSPTPTPVLTTTAATGTSKVADNAAATTTIDNKNATSSSTTPVPQSKSSVDNQQQQQFLGASNLRLKLDDAFNVPSPAPTPSSQVLASTTQHTTGKQSPPSSSSATGQSNIHSSSVTKQVPPSVTPQPLKAPAPTPSSSVNAALANAAAANVGGGGSGLLQLPRSLQGNQPSPVPQVSLTPTPSTSTTPPPKNQNQNATTTNQQQQQQQQQKSQSQSQSGTAKSQPPADNKKSADDTSENKGVSFNLHLS